MAELSQVPSSSMLSSIGSNEPDNRFIPFAAAVPTPSTGPTMGSGPVGAPVNITRAKKAAVAQATEAKKLLFGTSDDLRRLGTAITNGNDLGKEQLAQDLQSGEAGLIANRHGLDVLTQAPKLWALERGDAYDQAATRTTGEKAADSALGVASGAVGTLGGLASLGVGMVDPHAGAVTSDLVAGATDAIHGAQSKELNTQRAAAAVRAQLNQEDINRQYTSDVAQGKEYAGLRRFGREVLSGGADLVAHPELAADMVSEGVGSLAAGVVTRGLGIGAKAMPLVIGLLEAGGSYQDVQNQVQAMDDATLLKGSPEYAAMRANGLSVSEARDKIAQRAGTEAAAIAGVGGALSGKLVAGFESNLFGHAAGKGFVGSLRELGKTSLSEFTEEGIQGASGGLASNVGIQDYANKDQSLTEGLGRQVIQGAIAGLGSAGPVQLPHLAVAGLSDTGKGLAQIGRAVVDAGKAKIQGTKDSIDAQSPTGTNALSTAVATIGGHVQTVKEAVAEAKAARAASAAAAVPTVDSANIADTSVPADPVQTTPAVAPKDAAAQQKQADLEAKIEKVSAMTPDDLTQMVKVIESGKLPKEAVVAGSLQLREYAKLADDILKQDLSGYPEAVKQSVTASKNALNTVLSNPTVAAAIKTSETATSADLGNLGSVEITKDNVKTEEVARAAKNTLSLITANPGGVDPKFAQQLLDHSDDMGLSESDKSKLKAAKFLAEEVAKTRASKEQLLTETKAAIENQNLAEKPHPVVDPVTQAIKDVGGKAKFEQHSLSAHQAQIVADIDNGDTKRAQIRLDRLKSFAEHMQNKVRAARESQALKRKSDNKIKFRTWTGLSWIEANQNGASDVYIPNSPAGDQLLKNIEMDADLVRNQYNKLIDIYAGWRGVHGSQMAPVDGYAPSSVGPVKTLNIAQKDQENAITDPKPAEAQGSQGGSNSQGSSAPAEDKTDTPPPESEAGAGNGGAGSTGSNTGAGTDESGAGGEPQAGADPEPVTPVPPEAKPAEPLSNLPKGKGGFSRFLRAFKLNPDKSKLMSSPAPARLVLNALSDFEKGQNDMGLTYRLSVDKASAWSTLVGDHGGRLVNALNARLSKPSKNIRNLTPLQALEQASKGDAPVDWLANRDTMGLNMVDPTKGKYEPRLVQAAMLAAIHWAMTTPRSQNMDDGEIASVLGKDISTITGPLRDAINRGLGIKPAVESLAKMIRDFWGVDENRDAPMSDHRGLSEHMAIELLLAMTDETYGEFGRLEKFDGVDSLGDPVTHSVIYLDNPKTDKLREKLIGTKNFLGDAFVPAVGRAFNFGTPPEPKKWTQKRNFLARLGKRMLRALQVQRETPVFLNETQMDLMKAMGQRGWMDLMGQQPVDPKRMNQQHRLSVEGRNNSILYGWDGVMEYEAQLQAYVAKQNEGEDPAEHITAADVPMFADFYAASNERQMAEGFSQQADKNMREAAVSTRSVLDMTKKGDRQKFWLTVGQSSGLVKTEKDNRPKDAGRGEGKARAYNAELAEKKIRANFPKTLEVLKDWLSDTKEPLTVGQIDAINGEMKKLSSNPNFKSMAKLMHALHSVARLDLLNKDGKENAKFLKKFEHNLSLEADGKTDGPMHVITHFTTGEYTEQEIANSARSGLFYSEHDMTLNEQFNRDPADLYEMTKSYGNVEFAERRRVLNKNPQSGAMMAAIDRVLRILGDVGVDAKGLIELTRDGVKNPFTITGYGSGVDGIAGKVVSLMLDKLYPMLTDLEEKKLFRPDAKLADTQAGFDVKQFKADLALLTGQRLTYEKDAIGRWHWVVATTTSKNQTPPALHDLEDGVNFKLSPEQFQMLQANIKHGYVTPMVRAISKVFGNAQDTMKVFQRATQVQSKVLMAHFQRIVKEELAAKRERGELGSGEFLSPNDYDNIYKKLAKYGAIIEPVATDENSLNLSMKESARTRRDFSRGFGGEFAGDSQLAGPGEAGVAAAPLLTISRGDAAMMVNFYAAKDAVEAGAHLTTQVYDGLEMASHLMDELSVRINKVVSDAWEKNPSQDVADSFSDWLRQGKNGPLDGLTKADLVDLGILEEGVTPELIYEELVGISDELHAIARSTQARVNVRKRIAYSVDHMAGAEAPYNSDGEFWDGTEPKVDWMNRIYREELAKLPKVGAEARNTAPDAVAPKNAELTKRLEQYGDKILNAGSKEAMTRVSAKTMFAALDSDLVPAMQKPVLRALGKILPNFTFMIGSAEALTEWRNNATGDGETRKAIKLGQTDISMGVIFITNPSAETIIHEMLHGALAKILSEHYAGMGSVTPDQKTAIENLEKLMAQFMDMDFSHESTGVAKAARLLKNELTNYAGDNLEAFNDAPEGELDVLGITRKSAAMSEFIAWTLTNQNLRDVLSVTKTRTGLGKFIDTAIGHLKRILGLPSDARMDVFTNIAMNSGLLLDTLKDQVNTSIEDSLASGMVLDQADPTTLAGDRMRKLREDFETKIGAHLKASPVLTRDTEELAIYDLADQALSRFTSAGCRFSPEQASTFRVIQAAMASTMEIAPGAMAQTQKLFQHFIKDLSVEKLMVDPTDQLERISAEDKFDAIVGKTGGERDQRNRSNLMASVMALAMVDEDFRNVLEKTPLPEDRKISYASADDFLNSLGESMMNTLGTAISEEGRGLAGFAAKNRNTKEALDQLAQVLARIEKDDRSRIETGTEALINKGEGYIVDMMQKAGTKLFDLGSRKPTKGTLSDIVKNGMAASARTLAGLVLKSHGDSIAEAMVGFANESTSKLYPLAAKELLSEVVGMTDTNKGAYKLLAVVKSMVSAVRQDYREKMPKILAEQFTRVLKGTEWTALHLSLARTDIAALGSKFSGVLIRGLINDDAKLTSAISKEEAIIQKELSSFGASGMRIVTKKANELARYMVTREIDPNNHNLLKNAAAISRLLGETGQNRMKRLGGPSEALVQAVDIYVTLKALELTRTAKPEAWAVLKDLSNSETSGVDFLLYSLVDLRRKEMERVSTDAAKMNGWKGYVPEEAAEGARLIVADDKEHNQLITLGYTREGTYQGSGFETGTKSYYYSSVGGNNAYLQGAMQTVQVTAMGVDPANGRNVSGQVAGSISGRYLASIESLVKSSPKSKTWTGEALIPVYDGDGIIVAYERSMKSEMQALMQRDTHLGKMMGAWAGRQEEEKVAESYNELLIDEMKKVWDKAKAEGRTKEFQNISDPALQDKVFGEAWKMIPAATKAYLQDAFKDEPGFMVRSDMINNTLGYRMPSVKDAWDGATRMDPVVSKVIRDSATLLLGANAVPWLVTAEKAWQTGISVAKNTIVVKSIIVPLSNEVSNTMQLMTRGVPLRIIVKSKTAKLVEINQHLKNLDRAIEIKAQLARHRDDTLITSKLTAQLKSLADSSKSMSIWPLIEAGQFSTISEGQTEADAALQSGKWAEYIRGIIEKVPAKLGTVGRYALITRDTALFQGMSRAVQYSDFLAKAVLYDHEVKAKKTDKDKAMEKVSKEFVDYNFLPGRVRSYNEAMGVTWFWAYKLRSIGVALNTVRENPLRAFLTSYGAQYAPNLPGVSVGSPVTDNAVSIIMGNRQWYSLGLGMLWSAPGLNPWAAAWHSL